MTTPLEKFAEPAGDQLAGTMKVNRRPSPYENFMIEEGIPVHRAGGFLDVRDLELGDWARVGGRGAYLVPDNTVDLLGMYIVEIPPGGLLEPERHLYEEKYWVIEGEGTTEVWSTRSGSRQRFEWHSGSLFAVPLNCWHQLVNGTGRRALLLAGTTAPPMINSFFDRSFVFENDYHFAARYDDNPDFYEPQLEALATPELGRAMWKTNIIPDIVHCELPLDNQRSPGYRRIEPHMANSPFWCFIGEHVPGRYSKAHAHASGAVLICVKGAGYTFNWPTEAGITPWKSGRADTVEIIEYVAGGLVAAAPGGGEWYHQHFGVGSEPLRFLVFSGGVPGRQYSEYGGREQQGKAQAWLNADIEDGGKSISYPREDPYVRETFRARVYAVGGTVTMDETLYK